MFECREPIAFYDGQLLPADEVAIPFWDLAYAQGVGIVEQVRTYGGRLPLLEYHLSRLQRGLRRLNLDDGRVLDAIRFNIDVVAKQNHEQLPSGSDLGICVVFSAGSVTAFVPASVDLSATLQPKVLIHSFPLPFAYWKDEFRRGVRLATTTICEIPKESISHEFKHRNRLHYYLAQQEVDHRNPGCRPVLATQDGLVADSTTAGILIFRPQVGWVAPMREHALHSVTVEVVEALAMAAGIGFARRAIGFDELESASEVICCGTPTGPLPAIELDGRPIGGGRAGPQYATLAQLWSERVGLDFRQQALAIADL